MPDKRLLVTGANGLLGEKIVRQARTMFDVIATDLQPELRVDLSGVSYVQADITDRKQCEKLSEYNPQYIIHTAAYTNVDNCEIEKETAYMVNVTGTENIAFLCDMSKSKMIHLSTDYVFDGLDGPYTEEDEVNPISYYGKTKLESEIKAREIVKNLVIARTTVLYGYSPGARPNFATWVIEKLKAGKKISIVDDQYGNPTLADDLAQACIVLCRPGITGVYNTVGASLLNRYEFALEIAKVFKLDKSLICKTKTESLNQKAARPLKGGLFTDKLFRDTGFRFLSAEQGLIKMKKQMEA